jgi:hypothetical protein
VSRSDNSSKGCKTYGRRGPGFRVNWVRPRNKAARKKVRDALRVGGGEPGTATALTHRHSALWDRF